MEDFLISDGRFLITHANQTEPIKRDRLKI